jgi:NAD(P)-dependent dehydrogenase (short-subunit alcohol dehydrogenase family)
MLLEGKNAIIYGGAGAIGGAVARAFAGEGARIFLAGRTLENLERVAETIKTGGIRPSSPLWQWPNTFFRSFVPALVEEGLFSSTR